MLFQLSYTHVHIHTHIHELEKLSRFLPQLTNSKLSLKFQGKINIPLPLPPPFSLKLVAADSGYPPLITERNFTVEILDVNDSPPEFTADVFETTLEEGASPGAAVLTVEAKDADEGVNAEITYNLVHEDPWFQINSDTGLITTKAKIDCDTNPHPQILVRKICF